VRAVEVKRARVVRWFGRHVRKRVKEREER
jgi:hypothetical protein